MKKVTVCLSMAVFMFSTCGRIGLLSDSNEETFVTRNLLEMVNLWKIAEVEVFSEESGAYMARSCISQCKFWHRYRSSRWVL